MKTQFIKIIFTALIFWSFAQQTNAQTNQKISLQECYKKSKTNFPQAKEQGLNLKINELKIQNLKARYLPSLNFQAQATYQSDVVEVPIDNPMINIPSPAKDQYKATLDIRQTIYDGGATRAAIDAAQAENRVTNQSIEVELYKLRNQVNEAYFMVLFLQEQKKQIQLIEKNLVSKRKAIESGIENGVALPSDLDLLNAEILKVKQKIVETEYGRKTGLDILQELTGMDNLKQKELELPVLELEISGEYYRPEDSLFLLQKESITSYANMLDAKRMPRLGAFAQLGYGRPGLNLLSDEFDSYYIVGANVSWNIWDWNKTKRERKILSIQQKMISTRWESFELNKRIQLSQKENELEKLQELINMDKEIIELRSKVAKTAESKFDNGTMTLSDYIEKVNAEGQARISLKLHEIQIIKTKAEYQTITGKKK